MYYIYKTTNIINGKFYIGLHKSECIEKDNYLGSGKSLISAIKKHGRENFKREILYVFNTLEEASDMEAEIVNETFVKNRETYNMKTGGINGWLIQVHNKGKVAIYSPLKDVVYYVNENDLQSFLEEGWIRGNNHVGKICISKGKILKYVRENNLQLFLDEGWEKSNTTKNKVCMTNPIEMKLIYVNKEFITDYEKQGFILGNLLSGVNKNRIYVNKNNKNKRIDNENLDLFLSKGWIKGRVQKKIKIKRMYNPDTGELKNIELENVDEFLKNGWILGVNYIGIKNRIYITKNTQNKRIHPHELDSYLNDGWKKGMYSKNKTYEKGN